MKFLREGRLRLIFRRTRLGSVTGKEPGAMTWAGVAARELLSVYTILDEV